MMQELNSIILEGSVRYANDEQGLIVYQSKRDMAAVCFEIRHQRAYEGILEEGRFTVEAGEPWGTWALSNLKYDTNIRVVGRVIASKEGVVIRAEHIEVKK